MSTETFEPEYYLVRRGKIEQVEEPEYRKAAGSCGANSTGFAMKGVRGFTAENSEERELQLLFHREWLTQGIEATRARVLSTPESPHSESQPAQARTYRSSPENEDQKRTSAPMSEASQEGSPQ